MKKIKGILHPYRDAVEGFLYGFAYCCLLLSVGALGVSACMQISG